MATSTEQEPLGLHHRAETITRPRPSRINWGRTILLATSTEQESLDLRLAETICKNQTRMRSSDLFIQIRSDSIPKIYSRASTSKTFGVHFCGSLLLYNHSYRYILQTPYRSVYIVISATYCISRTSWSRFFKTIHITHSFSFRN